MHATSDTYDYDSDGLRAFQATGRKTSNLTSSVSYVPPQSSASSWRAQTQASSSDPFTKLDWFSFLYLTTLTVAYCIALFLPRLVTIPPTWWYAFGAGCLLGGAITGLAVFNRTISVLQRTRLIIAGVGFAIIGTLLEVGVPLSRASLYTASIGLCIPLATLVGIVLVITRPTVAESQ
jgi:hypothetical protein